MPTVPSLGELEDTIERMERRYAISERSDILRLVATYERLRDRFAEDLADGRDIALSCAAALMMIRYLADDAPV